MANATNKAGASQRFSTEILVKGQIGKAIPLSSTLPWVSSELKRFSGNLLASEVIPDNGPPLNVISVYSPAWPVARERLVDVDVSDVKLMQNSDIWITDLLRTALQHPEHNLSERWVVGGDFNASETFDAWKDGPRGNKEYFERLNSLGLEECLRTFTGILTPTFQNPRGKIRKHQMDHLFVSATLKERLRGCRIAPYSEIFDTGLSDHTPIIADFEFD